MLKKIVKQLLPKRISKAVARYKLRKMFRLAYFYDLRRYFENSDSKNEKSERNRIGLIVRRYHAIEKGLTMPELRLGFGKQMLIDLVDDCLAYIERYGYEEGQLRQALSVILEYKDLHDHNGFRLDDDLVKAIGKIVSLTDINGIDCSKQREFCNNSYFKYVNSPFPDFAKSRASIRSFSNQDVSLVKIANALELAKTAPSACNRQSWRTYVFSDKARINEILGIQGGNRGFGHLANKLILIVSETGVFSGPAERNQAYIDGGIYAMNLLYSLHANKIGACILNCSNSVSKDITLRKLCNIKDSEVFIAFIACGIPPQEMRVAASVRYPIGKTNVFVN